MLDQLNIAPNYRYERKFTAQNTERAFVLEQIKRHPAFFRSIFQPRKINNIYLDTDQLKFYDNNKIGIATRKKIRIRWYGDTFGNIQNPKLEYKLKSNLVGDKWTFDLNDFNLQAGFESKTLIALFEQSNLPEPILADLRLVKPSLLNTYHRSYFLSADGNYRLTFDEKMNYYRMSQSVNYLMEKHQDLRNFIIELKYGIEHDDLVNNIAKRLPYRLTKSSKYVNGIDLTSPTQDK